MAVIERRARLAARSQGKSVFKRTRKWNMCERLCEARARHLERRLGAGKLTGGEARRPECKMNCGQHSRSLGSPLAGSIVDICSRS